MSAAEASAVAALPLLLPAILDAFLQRLALEIGMCTRSVSLAAQPCIPRSRCLPACSPLPFDVPAADSVGKGLMAHSATHTGSAAAVALLHGAGARLDLQRFL